MYHVRKLSFKTVFFKHSSHPSFNLFVNNITIFDFVQLFEIKEPDSFESGQFDAINNIGNCGDVEI